MMTQKVNLQDKSEKVVNIKNTGISNFFFFTQCTLLPTKGHTLQFDFCVYDTVMVEFSAYNL